MEREDTTREFLDLLFGDALTGDVPLYLYTWALSTKQTFWHRTTKDAARIIQVTDQSDDDVYIGAGLRAEPRPPHERILAKDVRAIVGLWADVDVRQPDSKKAYPPSLDEAIDLISTHLKPTVIVYTGHGIHAWWLFKEPWVFEKADDNAAAALLSKRWQRTILVDAQRHKWDIDMTNDLARIMRPAGTENHKDKEEFPRPYIHYEVTYGSPRYDPSDFDEYLVEDRAINFAPTSTMESSPLTYDPGANPPFDKLETLRREDDEFNQTWDEKSKRHKSESEVDWFLVTTCAMARWERQEAYDLLVYHRRVYHKDPKRPDYFERTIRKAYEQVQGDTALEEVLNMPQLKASEVTHGDDDEIDHRLAAMSSVFNLEIVRSEKLVAHDGDPTDAQWQIVTRGDVTMMLGTAKDILRGQDSVRALVMTYTDRVMPSRKAKDWENIVQRLIECAIVVRLDRDSSPQTSLSEQVSDYLFEHALVPFDEYVDRMDPMRHETGTYISSTGFRSWINDKRGVRYKQKDFASKLRSLGFVHRDMPIPRRGDATMWSMWRVPNGLIPKRETMLDRMNGHTNGIVHGGDHARTE